MVTGGIRELHEVKKSPGAGLQTASAREPSRHRAPFRAGRRPVRPRRRPRVRPLPPPRRLRLGRWLPRTARGLVLLPLGLPALRRTGLRRGEDLRCPAALLRLGRGLRHHDLRMLLRRGHRTVLPVLRRPASLRPVWARGRDRRRRHVALLRLGRRGAARGRGLVWARAGQPAPAAAHPPAAHPVAAVGPPGRGGGPSSAPAAPRVVGAFRSGSSPAPSRSPVSARSRTPSPTSATARDAAPRSVASPGSGRGRSRGASASSPSAGASPPRSGPRWPPAA